MIKRLAIGAMAVVLTACPWDSNEPKVSAVIAVAGDAQTVVAGSAVPVAPSVKVVDGKGNGVDGIKVTFALTQGGGTIIGGSATTAGGGVATLGAWVTGKAAGANKLKAAVDGAEFIFTVTGIAGAPATIVGSVGTGQIGTVGKPVTVVPGFRVFDANQNGVPNVDVTVTVTAGGGAITGGTTTTDATGVAMIGSWTMGTISATNTISAATPLLPSPATINVNALPGPPTKLYMVRDAVTAYTGEELVPAPVVGMRDTYGNTVNGTNSTITAGITSGGGALSGPTTVATLSGIATFADLRVTGTSAVTITYSAPGLTSVAAAPITPSVPPPFNLTIEGLHINQGSQTFNGSIPLIAGRAGMVRVFVKANRKNTENAVVRVRTYDNGTLFKTYTIPTPPMIGAPLVIDSSALGPSWNVVIPMEEMVEKMSIIADVDPTGVITEGSDTDNSFPVSGTPLALDVRVAPTFKVMLVPSAQPGGTVAGDMTNPAQYLDYATRVYPFAAVEYTVHAQFTTRANLPGTSYETSWQNWLQDIRAMRIAEGNATHYYYGVGHPSYTSGVTGLGYIGYPSAVGMDFTGTVQPSTNYRSMTAAHEWGHNFGRTHVNCGNPSNPDPNYPHDPNIIGFTGFDAAFGLLRDAYQYREFMSYCQPLWISDYTYKAVMDSMAARSVPGGVRVAQRGLLVRGTLSASGIVLEPAFEIDAVPVMPSRPGPYRLQASDADGRALFDFSFEGDEIDHLPGQRQFTFFVPLAQSGASPTTLRLSAGGREVVRRGGIPAAAGGSSTAQSATRLRATGANRARLEWDASAYPHAMVRDPATGQVLGFVAGGSAELAVNRPDVDVIFSTGPTSIRQRLQVIRR